MGWDGATRSGNLDVLLKWGGLCDLSASKNTTYRGLVSPGHPYLYTNFCKFAHLTCCKLLTPVTKQVESRLLDFPEPLNSVMALYTESKLATAL